jgi:hypothetical protein
MSGGGWKSGVILSAITLGGALAAFALIPRVFSGIETDLERTKFLLRTVRDIKSGKVEAPNTVVLGNSVTMNGVDTALIGPGVYNFSSTGQSVAEGYLYLQELPKETTSVVLVVSPGNLEDDKMVPDDVFNTFYMQGYRIQPSTRETLQEVFGKESTGILSFNEVQQRFQSRWAISQMPDTELRKRIRKDLETSKSILSLTYPAPYTKPIPAANFEKLLPTYNKERKSPLFSPLKTQIDLIGQIAKQMEASGRKFTVVLAPMHRRRLSFAGPEFVSSLKEWARSAPFGESVRILDLSDVLTDAQFIDVVHPTRDGAEIVSRRIAEFLKEPHAKAQRRKAHGYEPVVVASIPPRVGAVWDNDGNHALCAFAPLREVRPKSAHTKSLAPNGLHPGRDGGNRSVIPSPSIYDLRFTIYKGGAT